MTKERIMIGFPHGGKVDGRFTESLADLIFFELNRPSEKYELVRVKGIGSVYVEDNRNDLVEVAKEEGVDWLFQLDTDESFKPDLLRLIMRTAEPVKRPFIVGLYANTAATPDGEFMVVDHIFGETENGDYKPAKVPENLQPFRVDAAGTGVFLTHMSMYEKMMPPWYWLEKIWVRGKVKPQTMNEDIAFCRKAREVGYEIWCDPLAEVVHWKNVPLVSSNMRTFLQAAWDVEELMSKTPPENDKKMVPTSPIQ
jgi:hypothetical protein